MKKDYYVAVDGTDGVGAVLRAWWVECCGSFWLQDEKHWLDPVTGKIRPSAYDREYGEPLGSGFTFARALKEAKEAEKAASWEGGQDVRSRIFRLTAKGLVEVRKTGKDAGRAKQGAKPLR